MEREPSSGEPQHSAEVEEILGRVAAEKAAALRAHQKAIGWTPLPLALAAERNFDPPPGYRCISPDGTIYYTPRTRKQRDKAVGALSAEDRQRYRNTCDYYSGRIHSAHYYLGLGIMTPEERYDLGLL